MSLNPFHIAFIPARKGSKGFPFKNRLLFDATADFIDREGWFKQVIVSTDDEIIQLSAQVRNYSIHHRSEELSGDAASIKSVLSVVIDEMKIPDEALIWLFYLTIVYKSSDDFSTAKQIMEANYEKNLCSFVPVLTHPYNCWWCDEKDKIIKQYIPNNNFRRQDLPPAWMHHHYICCFKAGIIETLNNELIGEKTIPFFLSEEKAERVIEIDSLSDYERCMKLFQQK